MIGCAPVKLSARAAAIGESATLRVTRRAAELKARGVKVMDFGAGEPDFPSPQVAVEAARQALAEGFTRYTPGSGTPELRAAIAESYAARWGSPWKGSDCVITVGGKAALFQLALALFEPGDEVVLPSPCWVSFPEQILFAGARPVTVPTSVEDGFRIHAGPLLEAVTSRTRAILLNSPCNPTGGVISPEDLRRVVAFAAERGLVVISDETYERFVYDAPPASAAALAAEFPETVALVGSFSKTYAMTGWRLGYLLGPALIVRAVESIQSHATSNPTSFSMVGALAALRHA
jgi:aspartate aminotransferase